MDISSFINMAGNHILGAVGGTQAVSIYAVVSRIQSFISTPFSGIMQGIQPMLGFDWGRKRPDRIKKTVYYAICFSMVYGSIFIIRLPLIIVGKVIGNITAIWWILVLSDWMIAAWAAGIYIKCKKEY